MQKSIKWTENVFNKFCKTIFYPFESTRFGEHFDKFTKRMTVMHNSLGDIFGTNTDGKNNDRNARVHPVPGYVVRFENKTNVAPASLRWFQTNISLWRRGATSTSAVPFYQSQILFIESQLTIFSQLKNHHQFFCNKPRTIIELVVWVPHQIRLSLIKVQ